MMRKGRAYLTCTCSFCRRLTRGARRQHRTAANRKFRHASKHAIYQYLNFSTFYDCDPDWECGPVWAGWWD